MVVAAGLFEAQIMVAKLNWGLAYSPQGESFGVNAMRNHRVNADLSGAKVNWFQSSILSVMFNQ
jgi:hypothetical protein